MFSIAVIVIASCIGLAPAPPAAPKVALIFDDIGNNYEHGRAAIELPHPFAYAMLPFSPHAKSLAHMANSLDKDVLVHLPMEAEHDNHLLGPGALRVDMSQHEIESTVLKSIAAIPHAIGINNHMGSRLTRESAHMRWLMHAIHRRGGLFFVDSRTTTDSVALEWAERSQIAASFRDVFLDNVQSRRYIEDQLNTLVKTAKINGHALGIAHPHPLTIDVFQKWNASETGIQIVKLSEYIQLHQTIVGPPSRPLQTRHFSATKCGNDSDDSYSAENPYTKW